MNDLKNETYQGQKATNLCSFLCGDTERLGSEGFGLEVPVDEPLAAIPLKSSNNKKATHRKASGKFSAHTFL